MEKEQPQLSELQFLEADVLRLRRENPQISQAEIAKRLGVSQWRVETTITSLNKSGADIAAKQGRPRSSENEELYSQIAFLRHEIPDITVPQISFALGVEENKLRVATRTLIENGTIPPRKNPLARV